MNLTEVIKSQQFFKDLTLKKEKNILSNAIMFFCDDDVTSKTVLILSALLFEYKTFDLMNEASAEFLRIENGADLDIKIFPKGNDKLKVADSNEIVADCYVKPVNLPYKIYILNNFDYSTDEAQNKLLKVLEEPPENVYFLLSAKSEDRVLPTIRSRCDKIKINPLAKSEIEKVCQDPLAVVLGGGHLGKTLHLSKMDDLKSIVNFAVSILCELKNSKQVLQFSNEFLNYQSELDLILNVIALCLEDILKLKCESENLMKLYMYKDELKEVDAEYSVRAICEIEKLISTLREKLEFNANLTVTLDNFLLKILEVKYLCK